MIARVASLVVLVSSIAVTAGAQDLARVGSEFQVNVYTPGRQWRPDLGIADSGGFVVTWAGNRDGDSDGVFGRRFDSGGAPLADEFQVNTVTVSFQFYPHVAVDGEGAFVVSWVGGPVHTVKARLFDSAGIAQTQELEVGAGVDPDVAFDDAGAFVVVWRDNSGLDGDGDGVFAQRFDSAGIAQGDPFQVNTTTTADQIRPIVAMKPGGGDFVVAWDSYAFGGDLFAQRFDSSGDRLGAEFLVNAYTTGGQYAAAVALDSEGAFVISWNGAQGQDGQQSGIFARRFDSTGLALGGEFQVNTYTMYRQEYSAMAATPAGFVVMWLSEQDLGAGESGRMGIFGRRFEPDGEAVATEFQVNTVTAGRQSYPAIAANEHGELVVTWNSKDQDGSDFGVFAQRYRTPALFDVDGNGSTDPLTDGILALRYMFGFRDEVLTDGAVGDGCLRCDSTAIEAYLEPRI